MPGRIPDHFIQELLARTDIVEVIGARVELKRAGREFKARSPFTEEKTPSFFVSPAKQMYFDFSSGRNGTALGFVMDFDRLGFVDAVELLAHRAGLEVPHEGGTGPAPELDGARSALSEAARLYRTELQRNVEARSYLAQRGIDAATAERFAIGYAPAAWDFIARRFKDPAAALAAGLVKRRDQDDGCYDVFRHRLMFPIRDTRGRVIGFGGRTLGDDPAKYLNSPETELFHKGRNLFGLYEARQAGTAAPKELIVVEGYVDTVMLAQYGFTNVVAALGTATTREHVALLFRSAPRVLYCFDGDRAGRAAAHRALEPLLPELRAGRDCRFVFLPEGDDPDTLVRREGSQGFAACVQQAQPLSDFLLAELAQDCDLTTVAGRARLVEKARTPFARLEDGALRAVLVVELAERSRLSPQEVQRLLTTIEHKPAAVRPRESAQAPGVVVRSRALRRALQLLGERPALAERVSDLGQLALAPVAGASELVAVLEFFCEHPNFTVSQLLEHWREDDRGDALARLWAQPLPDLNDDTAVDEFDAAIATIRHRALRARHLALLEQADREGLSAGAKHELQALTRQLFST